MLLRSSGGKASKESPKVVGAGCDVSEAAAVFFAERRNTPGMPFSVGWQKDTFLFFFVTLELLVLAAFGFTIHPDS